MPLPDRKRASLVLLLILAAGLGVAGAAAAASVQEMACCPATAAAAASPCAWLGAGDCCPERPVAPAPSNTAPPAPASCAALTLPVLSAAPAALPAGASRAPHTPRNSVLRL